MTSTNRSHRVAAGVLPHLDAAYRLACWHLGNNRNAEDAVYEAALRAVQGCESFSNEMARASFLRIVSRVCGEWRLANAEVEPLADVHDNHVPADSDAADSPVHGCDPSSIEEAIRSLPSRQREVFVLRDLEGLSYGEVADVVGASIDAVTASLSQSRRALSRALARQATTV